MKRTGFSEDGPQKKGGTEKARARQSLAELGDRGRAEQEQQEEEQTERITGRDQRRTGVRTLPKGEVTGSDGRG